MVLSRYLPRYSSLHYLLLSIYYGTLIWTERYLFIWKLNRWLKKVDPIIKTTTQVHRCRELSSNKRSFVCLWLSSNTFSFSWPPKVAFTLAHLITRLARLIIYEAFFASLKRNSLMIETQKYLLAVQFNVKFGHLLIKVTLIRLPLTLINVWFPLQHLFTVFVYKPCDVTYLAEQ